MRVLYACFSDLKTLFIPYCDCTELQQYKNVQPCTVTEIYYSQKQNIDKCIRDNKIKHKTQIIITVTNSTCVLWNVWSCSQHKNNHFHLTTTIMNHHWQQNTLQNTCNTEICDPSGSNWTNSPHVLLSSIMQEENKSWYTHWQWHETHIVQTTKQLTLVSLNKDVTLLTGQRPRSVCGPDTALSVIPFFFQYGASPGELHPTLYRYHVVAFFCITVNFPRLFVLTEQQTHPLQTTQHVCLRALTAELQQTSLARDRWATNHKTG